MREWYSRNDIWDIELYDRFTDRARRVMQFAIQEARRLNHEYIGTEHLFLGLIMEGTGVAAKVLNNLHIDLRIVRREVEKIVQAGPDVVALGKLPQTPRLKRVVECSIEEANALRHNYVGTEHLLLGLMRDRDNVAGQILLNLGLSFELIRNGILALVGAADNKSMPQTSSPDSAELPSTIERARTIADRLLDLLQAIKMDAVSAMDLEYAAKVNQQMESLLEIKAWLQRELRRKPPGESEDGIQVAK